MKTAIQAPVATPLTLPSTAILAGSVRSAQDCVVHLSATSVVITDLPSNASGRLCLPNEQAWQCQVGSSDAAGVFAIRLAHPATGGVFFETQRSGTSVPIGCAAVAETTPVNSLLVSTLSIAGALATGILVAYLSQYFAFRRQAHEVVNAWIFEYIARLEMFVHDSGVDPKPRALPFVTRRYRRMLAEIVKSADRALNSLGIIAATREADRKKAVEPVLARMRKDRSMI